MSLDSFLRDELSFIDREILKGKTTFTFKHLSLCQLTLFAASEQVFFYESKDSDFSYLGLGKSKDFTETGAKMFLESHPQIFLVYQGQFEVQHLPMIYLPEWVFIKRNEEITLHVYHSQEFQSYSPSNLLFNPNVWESFIGPWISYEEMPERDEWEKMITEAQKLFDKKILEKIVLSRKKIFRYNEKIELPVMFLALHEGSKGSSHFTIFHQLNDSEAFISLTPERLFTLKEKTFESISLAGSAPRGTNLSEDQVSIENLLNNERLKREHDLVTEDIKSKLQNLIQNLTISPLETMKLPYIFHRQASLKGELGDGVGPFDLIEALHPTAAVGGLPCKLSQVHIKRIEENDRGFYAAPVGIISKNFSEIAVGIRSGHINDHTLTVYGGAGIVAGSEADEEWMETGIKMQPFIKVINSGVI